MEANLQLQNERNLTLENTNDSAMTGGDPVSTETSVNDETISPATESLDTESSESTKNESSESSSSLPTSSNIIQQTTGPKRVGCAHYKRRAKFVVK